MKPIFAKYGTRYLNLNHVQYAKFDENGFLGTVKDGHPERGPTMNIWFGADEDPVELLGNDAILARNLLDHLADQDLS